MIECCTRRFLSNKPWLDPNGRLGAHQSDNASNYRDPIHVVDNASLGSHVFNEPGEGKDEGDKNGGSNVQGLKRLRDSSNRDVKHHQEDADDYLRGLNQINIPANSYSKVIIDRANEDTGRAGRDATQREHLLWVVRKHLRDGGVGNGDGSVAGGVEGAAAIEHDRYSSAAKKAGQCKASCKACAATKAMEENTVEGDDGIEEGELELVKWEVS